MNVMCTAWILIDWPEQMEVMRFNTRVTISKRACVRARVCVCEERRGGRSSLVQVSGDNWIHIHRCLEKEENLRAAISCSKRCRA